MEKANIIFMGTPEIAVPTLKKLNDKYNIQAVVTVPDKPKGRGLKLQYSPVKEAALELGLEVLQPIKMRDEDFVSAVKNYSPDIIVVFAFRILPDVVYKAAKIASFNIHTSLLPKYRGAAPINWAVINGEKKTGLTTFILKDTVDTGDILLQHEIEILEDYTAGDLHDRMMFEAPDFAVKTCELLLSGKYELKSQSQNDASSAPKIFRENAKIDWNQDAVNVVNFINGYSPSPCAFAILNDETIKIYRAKVVSDSALNIGSYNNMKAGDFVIDNNSFYVKCGNGLAQIVELQLQGKKRMLVKDFLCGYRGNKNGSFSL